MSTSSALEVRPHVDDDEHGQSLSVRFDDQCILIPELPNRHRLPKMVAKSYSLPLWKRRSSSLGGSPSLETDAFVPEDKHVVLRVPIPSFSSKAQSPTRARRSDPKPLSPCLVHRSPSGPLPDPGSPQIPRRPPRTASLSPSRSDLVRIPLRPCCAACEVVTEASRLQGDTWTEHFSRSARRRRAFSADEGPRTITVEGSVAAASFGLGRGVPINVDEVDKRRRSTDLGVTTEVWLNEGDCSTLRETSAARTHQPLIVSTQRSSSPLRIPNMPSTPRIPEEEDDEDDEDQLFPLPSPRRSPVTSPAPSPSASASCIGLGRPTGSPVLSNSSSASLGTKTSKDRFLAPPVSRSSSSLSLAKTAESDDIPLRVPSPHLLVMAPSISARPVTCSPPHTCAPTSHRIPSSTWTEGLCADSEQLPSPVPSSASAPVSILSRTRKESRSPRSRVPSSPSTSPNLANSSNKRRHGSFTIARPRHIIADVLRGVGAIGGSAGGIGVRV